MVALKPNESISNKEIVDGGFLSAPSGTTVFQLKPLQMNWPNICAASLSALRKGTALP